MLPRERSKISRLPVLGLSFLVFFSRWIKLIFSAKISLEKISKKKKKFFPEAQSANRLICPQKTATLEATTISLRDDGRLGLWRKADYGSRLLFRPRDEPLFATSPARRHTGANGHLRCASHDAPAHMLAYLPVPLSVLCTRHLPSIQVAGTPVVKLDKVGFV